MTREEPIATVPVGWRFLIERLYRQKPETCVILGVRRHGGRLQIRTSPPPPEYQAQLQAIACQRSPYTEPPGSGILSHPRSPNLSQQGRLY
jgi:hypothetical protein